MTNEVNSMFNLYNNFSRLKKKKNGKKILPLFFTEIIYDTSFY
jgi:hypothetical protein